MVLVVEVLETNLEVLVVEAKVETNQDKKVEELFNQNKLLQV